MPLVTPQLSLTSLVWRDDGRTSARNLGRYNLEFSTPDLQGWMSYRAEAEFVRTLAGRAPTQAEVMAHAMRLDKIIEPYVLRAGVARPPPAP